MSPTINSDKDNPDSQPDQSATSALPDELSYLITAFLPTKPTADRSKAYLVLASFCQGVRNSTPATKGQNSESATDSLRKGFTPLIVSRLAETNESNNLAGISFLAALFQIDRESASTIFVQDGLIEFVMDSLDIFPVSLQLSLEVAHLLGQASGLKSCRAIILAHSLQWLESKSLQTTDTAIRAAAAIALVKLSRGAVDTAEDSITEAQFGLGKEEELSKLMKGIVISENEDKSSLTDAIEGLAYLSADSAVKEALSNDLVFLSRLFSLVPRRKDVLSHGRSEINPALLYGIVAIISNICSYRPRLTEEEVHIQNLRRMAKVDKGAEMRVGDAILEDDEHCKERGRRLVAAGAVDALAAVVPITNSLGIRAAVGKALLSIVEDKENRGRVLQSGGAKALMLIVRQSMSSQPGKTVSLENTDLPAIQALAKLAITSSPIQVFGPDAGAAYDAIRPLSLLLLHSSSTLLQRFEVLMALTNLSSQSPESASRIAKADGLMNKVELLLLEEHLLVRRAAMELICNLISGSDEVFDRYGGGEKSRSQSKLQVLLALSDVDDTPTRLAASGALAILTSSPSTCEALFALHLERHRVLPILTELIDPSIASSDVNDTVEERGPVEEHPGLVHRGVVCAQNFLLSIESAAARKEIFMEAEKVGLLQALVKLVRGRGGPMDESVLQPAAKALNFLLESVK